MRSIQVTRAGNLMKRLAIEPVVIRIDTKLRARYEAALARLEAAMRAEPSAFHAKYQAVAEIIEHEPPLYLAGSLATDAAFFKAVLRESRQSVWRHLRVAQLTTPEQVSRYSPSRLSLAIAYVEASTQQAITEPGAIDFDTLEILLRDARALVKKPFRDATYTEILRATVHANAGRSKPRRPKAVNLR